MSSILSMCGREKPFFALPILAASIALGLAVSSPAPAFAQEGAAKSKARAAADSGGNNALQRRVEQLEEQLVDMQVTIGTLESLARSGGGRANGGPAAAGGGLGANDAARLEGMETQIRALSSEVQRLTVKCGRWAAAVIVVETRAATVRHMRSVKHRRQRIFRRHSVPPP